MGKSIPMDTVQGRKRWTDNGFRVTRTKSKEPVTQKRSTNG